MSAHSYWRIYITANNGDATYTEVVDMEMRATPSGANQCHGGTPIGSTNNYSGPAGAFDGNTGTYFNSQSGVPCWVGYQFASPVEVLQIAITDTLVNEAARAPKNFYIQYSDDGTNWTTTNTITNQTGWGTAETRTFNTYNLTLAGNITESLPITDWRVSVSRVKDAIALGTAVVTGTSYSISGLPPYPCNITLSPKIDYAFTASLVAVVGDLVVPSNPDATPHLFKVTAVTGDAKFGTTEPTYNLSGTTTSGNVTLTYVGPLVDGVMLVAKIPS